MMLHIVAIDKNPTYVKEKCAARLMHQTTRCEEEYKNNVLLILVATV
jgi:hypothetical protein